MSKESKDLPFPSSERPATWFKIIKSWFRKLRLLVKRSRVIRYISTIVSSGLAAFLVSTILIVPFWNWISGPSTYYVYLVGDFSEPSQALLRAGFDKAKKELIINHVSVRFETVDAKIEDAQRTSARLADKNDTLMIIGHANTTASTNALPNYIYATPPIPVILPIETNPNLLPNDPSKYYPVFRLAPTDLLQAAAAAKFATSHGHHNIWIVRDETANPIYTEYLANEFTKDVRLMGGESEAVEQGFEAPENLVWDRISPDLRKRIIHLALDNAALSELMQKVERSGTGSIQSAHNAGSLTQSTQVNASKQQAAGMNDSNGSTHQGTPPQARASDLGNVQSKRAKVVLATTNKAPPLSSEILTTLGIDLIFFVGGSVDNCSTFSQQIEQLYKGKIPVEPVLLMSNACADQDVHNRNTGILKEAYLTHPMLAGGYPESYGLRGTQSFLLAQQLIERTDRDFGRLSARELSPWTDGLFYYAYYLRKLLPIHSVADARNALRVYMEEAVLYETPFNIEDQRYTFNKEGFVKDSRFHLWRVEGNDLNKYYVDYE